MHAMPHEGLIRRPMLGFVFLAFCRFSLERMEALQGNTSPKAAS